MATRLSKLLIAAPVVFSCGMIGSASTYAQVETDGTVGPRLQLDGPEFAIRADLGTRAGRNLFHSFERFSLRTGERATFTGPNQIRNVLSRVTGGELSYIDGTIASTIPGADFFFINPAGVTFGPNATLDVQGSFHVSTADELRFSDGAVFNATDHDASSFTIAPPEAFGFLGAEPATITVDRSTLEVPKGEHFSIIGGDIKIDGGNNGTASGGQEGLVTAEVGTVNLAAAGGPGRARLADGQVTTARPADITLKNQAHVSTDGDGGGTVRIRGGRLFVDGGSSVSANNTGPTDAKGGIEILADDIRLRAGSTVRADAESSGSGGIVDVDAERIAIRSGSSFGSDTSADGDGGTVNVEADRILISGDGAEGFTGMGSDVLSGSGHGGVTTVRADDLRIRKGGQIRSSTFAQGNAGVVTVQAGELVIRGGEISSSAELFSTGKAGTVKVRAGELVIRGGEISSSAEDFSTGNAGTVKVRAGELKIRDGGVIASGTKAKGSGGTVTVKAERLVVSGDGANDLTGITSQADTGSTGKAGAVNVRAGELEIRDLGVIVSATFGSGDAGTVTVRAERLHIVGEGDSEFTTGISTGADFDRGPNGEVLLSTGNAGAVKVRAGELEIRDGGEISSVTFGSGNAGTVRVKAERRLHIVGGSASEFSTGISSSAARKVTPDGIPVVGQGSAGAVNVIVTSGDLEIRDDGEITSSAAGGGDAGKVKVEADRLVLDRAAITTTSASAGGGEIQLLVGDVIDLRDSEIFTSVVGGADPTAGNILIDPKVLVIDGSRIQANAPAGFGGRVTIIADNILVPGGDFEALLARGEISATGGDPTRAGTIAVNAPEVDLSAGLVVVEGAFIDTAPLRERCGARRDIGASSFTGVGRGGLPRSPDGPLASAYVVDEAAVAEAQKAGSRRTAGIAPTNVRLVGLSAPCAPLD